MKYIKLTQGKRTAVDDVDYDYLNQWNWYYGGGRARRKDFSNGRDNPITILMHRVIANRMGLDMSNEIDHISRKPLNNRRSNLRPATKTQQMGNVGLTKRNTSGYRGVSLFKKNGTWRAAIAVRGKNTHIGYYNTKKEAAEAYNRKAIEVFGEYAWLNPV